MGLSHPNLVSVVGAGAIVETQYVFWEYITGSNLFEWLKGFSLY